MVHDFPADGDYTFKLGFYYSPTGPLFGMNQGKGQEIEIAVNGERVALLEISPSMTLAKDGIKTPRAIIDRKKQGRGMRPLSKFANGILHGRMPARR